MKRRYFGTDGIRGQSNTFPMTPDLAMRVGIAVGTIFRRGSHRHRVVIGKDTDGSTMPQDLGVDGPRRKRTTEFVGRRSLFTQEGKRGDRKQLVGLSVSEGEPPLATGAHGIEQAAGAKRSLGYVTSSYFSPTLGRPIALGLIEQGASRHGQVIDIQHLGMLRRATVTAPCALDPDGDRLNA